MIKMFWSINSSYMVAIEVEWGEVSKERTKLLVAEEAAVVGYTAAQRSKRTL